MMKTIDHIMVLTCRRVTALMCLCVLYLPSVNTEQQVSADRLARVVGGTQVDPEHHENELKWIVALDVYFGNEKFHRMCSGSLIDAQWVMTAAHCVFGDGLSVNVTAHVGVYNNCYKGACDEAIEGEHFLVQQIIIHPEYNPIFLKSDIALLQLNGQSTYNPIQFRKEEFSDIDSFSEFGNSVTVFGWGDTSDVEFGVQESSVLQQGELRLINSQDCGQEPYVYIPSLITSDMVCASASSSDACQGDSGGPLYSTSEQKVVGIVSWGSACLSADAPGVYTDVGRFSSWMFGIVPSICEAFSCDGQKDCADGRDELYCCSSDEFYCANSLSQYTCLSSEFVCDGINHCDSLEDETSNLCDPVSVKDNEGKELTPDQVQCESDPNTIIQRSSICDGIVDCPGKADESAECLTCECKPTWFFNGNEYQGCVTTPEYPDQSWCYVEQNCGSATASCVVEGLFWINCSSDTTTTTSSNTATTTDDSAITTTATMTSTITKTSTSTSTTSTTSKSTQYQPGRFTTGCIRGHRKLSRNNCALK